MLYFWTTYTGSPTWITPSLSTTVWMPMQGFGPYGTIQRYLQLSNSDKHCVSCMSYLRKKFSKYSFTISLNGFAKLQVSVFLAKLEPYHSEYRNCTYLNYENKIRGINRSFCWDLGNMVGRVTSKLPAAQSFHIYKSNVKYKKILIHIHTFSVLSMAGHLYPSMQFHDLWS